MAHCHPLHQVEVSLDQFVAGNCLAAFDRLIQLELLDAGGVWDQRHRREIASFGLRQLILFIPGDPDPHLLKAGRDN